MNESDHHTPTSHDHREEVTILVGTTNRHKVDEIRSVLAGPNLPGGARFRVLGADSLTAVGPVEEDGGTFEDNAVIKARAYALRALTIPPEMRPRWVLADDSGLCVDALGGAPGVTSARYAGEGAGDEANSKKLLAHLRGVEDGRRDARFVCVIACAEVPASGGRESRILFTARGECSGRIAHEPRGTGGFGYDPLFFFPSLGKTFAQLSQEEKNRWSHRGAALREMRGLLVAAVGIEAARASMVDGAQDVPGPGI